MKLERILELLQIEHECMLRNSHGDCKRDCENCNLVQDDSELHEMYMNVIHMIQELLYWDKELREDEDEQIRVHSN